LLGKLTCQFFVFIASITEIMRTPFICANWKMYKTVTETVKYVKEFRALVKDVADVEIVLAPPFTSLHAAVESDRGCSRPREYTFQE
jgi:hypothetical protein